MIEGLRQPLETGAIQAPPAAAYAGDIVHDEDAQLAMWVLYELHYRGFEDADADWQGHPDVARYLRWLEEPFLAQLRAYDIPETDADAPMHTRIEYLIDSSPSADLAKFMQREATVEQFRDYLMLKSIYHLKESDPHSFVLPRIDGLAKVRLAELQYDEYGSGRPERLHAAMFAQSLEAAGLESDYGAYIDLAPATTLAVNNSMSLFGLRRSLRGAAMGHLAAFEATSSIPCRRVAQGMHRVGLGEQAAAYYEEHVEADAVHEQIAMREICGTLASEDPALVDDILLGVWTCLYLEYLDGHHIVSAWKQDASPLASADLAGAA